MLSRLACAVLLSVVLGFSPQAKSADFRNALYDGVEFSGVLLWAVGFSAAERAEIERDTLSTFEKRGVQAIAMIDLVPVDSGLSEAEVRELIAATGVQTILQLTDGSMKEYAANGGIEMPFGGPLNAVAPSQISKPSNGNQRHYPTATFRVRLLDTQGQLMIWFQDVTVSSHMKVKYGYLAEKALRKGARYALKDDLFKTTN